ncbi:hypothetical protein Taro_040052 [Colocasia esculenta]|uniref:Uncharacterized protein n=1 Tax=Colocasia esculenta TaxID=4460 RepID=A0A843WTB2_COLES|nr:hypothetical protein [Colocasia esculenta]
MPYRRGRMNIHQLSNDFMEREGHHPTRPEMFQMTQARTAPNGSVMWSNEQSRQMMDQMTQLMNPTPSEESDATANPPVLTPEEAFRQNSEIERMKKIIKDQERRIATQSTDIDVRVEAQVEARLAELKTQMLQSMDDRVLELIRMSGSGAPAVLPEDEIDEEVGDREDEGTFGEDDLAVSNTIGDRLIRDGLATAFNEVTASRGPGDGSRSARAGDAQRKTGSAKGSNLQGHRDSSVVRHSNDLVSSGGRSGRICGSVIMYLAMRDASPFIGVPWFGLTEALPGCAHDLALIFAGQSYGRQEGSSEVRSSDAADEIFPTVALGTYVLKAPSGPTSGVRRATDSVANAFTEINKSTLE